MSTEQQAYDFFVQHGWSPAIAAGITGNLAQESSLNPSEPNGYLAQWLGSRLAGLNAFAAAKREKVSGNSTVQLEYIQHELETSESGAAHALRSARYTGDPKQDSRIAARIFSEQYERPSEPMLEHRENYAEEVLLNRTGGWPKSTAQKIVDAPVEAVTGAAKVATTTADAAGTAVKVLTDPNTWLRVAEVIGGMILLAMGLRTLTTGSVAGPVSRKVVKGAAAAAVL